MNAFKITFEDILPIWENELWPGRESAIESHSAMTWPFDGDPNEIDMDIFKNNASFWGIRINKKLVGVNSGHKTSDMHYRSRGIWVHPDFRGQGLPKTLFTMLEAQAKSEGCEMIWSIPRKTALSSYTRFGFETVGDFIITETSDANIYVRKIL
tara:strand:+ start:1019 stop:1480 length:462 start_codon:yes stop_codon:yes gene_type:complete